MNVLRAFLLCMWPCMASAQSDASLQAQQAAQALEQASAQLDAADGARDRVKALTQTIHAFEDGLAAMRDGLRQAAIRERQLSERLRSRDAEVAQLLGVLQSIGGDPSPVVLLHPKGPMGTARAGMLLAELTPALNARAAGLRQDLDDVQTLRTLQTSAAARLTKGLTEIQTARAELNQAMANRTDLPMRFTADPVRTAILIETAETLDGFASGLAEMAPESSDTDALPSLEGRIGTLSLPVQGIVLREAGRADAAGIKRPGLILATRPLAMVTTPTAATIRYTGPLLDLGNVVILEPQVNVLFVLAGLDLVYGQAGQVISEGTPIGLMGGKVPDSGQSGSIDSEGAGTDRSETLYIEVRQNNETQNPQDWFQTDKDG